MLAKSSKFPTRIQFLEFRAKAAQSTTPHLRILTSPHAPSRLSVIVPVKVNKRAVVRNSFKRLVYDLVWKIIRDKNLDAIVMFKPIALLKGKVSEELIKNELSQNSSLF
jgi:RNase P protein component